jgi:hypothetical protein
VKKIFWGAIQVIQLQYRKFPAVIAMEQVFLGRVLLAHTAVAEVGSNELDY